MDRAGTELNTIGDPQTYQGLALSSDDRRVAVVYTSGIPENRDIWIMDAQRGTQSKFTFDAGEDNAPVWSPDNLRILFQGSREGSRRCARSAWTARSKRRSCSRSTPWPHPATGRQAASTSLIHASGTGLFADIWALPLFGDRKPFPLVADAVQRKERRLLTRRSVVRVSIE